MDSSSKAAAAAGASPSGSPLQGIGSKTEQYNASKYFGNTRRELFSAGMPSYYKQSPQLTGDAQQNGAKQTDDGREDHAAEPGFNGVPPLRPTTQNRGHFKPDQKADAVTRNTAEVKSEETTELLPQSKDAAKKSNWFDCLFQFCK